MLSHGCDVEAYIDAIREQLWAEAMYLYHSGETARLPRELIPMQQERAEEHRDRDDLIEDGIAALPAQGRYTLGDIVVQLGRAADGMSQSRITRALKNGGWVQTRTKAGRIWERRVTGDNRGDASFYPSLFLIKIKYKSRD